jgi:hypothetical protein
MRIRSARSASSLLVIGCFACSASDSGSQRGALGNVDRSVPVTINAAVSGSGANSSASGAAAVGGNL